MMKCRRSQPSLPTMMSLSVTVRRGRNIVRRGKSARKRHQHPVQVGPQRAASPAPVANVIQVHPRRLERRRYGVTSAASPTTTPWSMTKPCKNASSRSKVETVGTSLLILHG